MQRRRASVHSATDGDAIRQPVLIQHRLDAQGHCSGKHASPVSWMAWVSETPCFDFRDGRVRIWRMDQPG
ncbi:MAG: hypothetical protein EA400_14915 [Chromatiaceae bacterium]|nr:MAG: hypothetical protein EA400_14915 [Chromatiaceae bacterium]